jgi:hypothetical protein
MIMGLINYPELGSTASKVDEELEYFARYSVYHPFIFVYFE